MAGTLLNFLVLQQLSVNLWPSCTTFHCHEKVQKTHRIRCCYYDTHILLHVFVTTAVSGEFYRKSSEIYHVIICLCVSKIYYCILNCIVVRSSECVLCVMASSNEFQPLDFNRTELVYILLLKQMTAAKWSVKSITLLKKLEACYNIRVSFSRPPWLLVPPERRGSIRYKPLSPCGKMNV